MAHPEPTQGGEAVAAPLNTTQEAASAFSAFYDETPDNPQADAPTGDEPDNEIHAEAGEPEAADESTTEPTIEPEAPAIDPPVSWSAEAKDEFAKLPPEAQAIVAKRESEREKFVQAKASEAAEARKAAQAVEQQAAQSHANYLNTLKQLLPEIPAEPDPAWLNTAVYGDEGPQAFYAHQQARSAAIAQHQQVQQLMTQAGQAQAEQEATSRAAYDAEQHKLLADPETGIPGWSEPETRAVLAKDITAAAQALGYTPERLADVDATDVKALYAVSQLKAKADKWDALQKQKMEVVRAAKTLPAVNRPGTPSDKGSVQAERKAELFGRLKQTGNWRDAAKAFESIL